MESPLRQLLLASREVCREVRRPLEYEFLQRFVREVRDTLRLRMTLTPLLPFQVKDDRFARWRIEIHDKRSHHQEHLERIKRYRDQLRKHVATELGLPVDWIREAQTRSVNMFGEPVWLRWEGFYDFLAKRNHYERKPDVFPAIVCGIVLDELILVLTHGSHTTEEVVARIPGP